MSETIYPKPLPWSARAGATPMVHGPSGDYLNCLRKVLTQLRRVAHLDEELPWKHGQATPVRKILHDLGPCGLYRVDNRETVSLTPEALAWLENGDSALLAAVLHSRIRFVGELLIELAKQSRTHEELRAIANTSYHCGWKTLDPLRRRTNWLRALGLGELSYGGKMEITDQGRDLVKHLDVTSPTSIQETLNPSTDGVVEVSEPTPVVRDLLAELSEEALASRRQALSYVPKTPEGSSIEAIRSLTQSFIPKSTRSEFQQLCASLFGIKPTSANAAMTTLRALGLIEPVSRYAFSATTAAQEWVASRNDQDLVRIMHTHVSFIGELLREIEAEPTASGLARRACEQYGLPRPDVAGVRARLQILREAGLVTDLDHTRHVLTVLGRAFRDDLPTQAPVPEAEALDPDDDEGELAAKHRAFEAARVAEMLNMTASDTSHHKDFEHAVAATFRHLGLQAQHVGNSGETDVLVTVIVDPKTTYRVVVEVKTSANAVTEQSLNFNVLNDHRKQHDADFAVVVAPKFAGSRLRRWANEHKVSLIESRYLSDLVMRHVDAPLSPGQIRDLFGEGGAAEIDKHQSEFDHRRRTAGSVLSVVHAELQHPDDEVNGSLTHREIYMALRGNESPPSGQAVREALEFLASPMVSGLKKEGTAYYSTEKPEVTATRLRAIADAIDDAAQTST